MLGYSSETEAGRHHFHVFFVLFYFQNSRPFFLFVFPTVGTYYILYLAQTRECHLLTLPLLWSRAPVFPWGKFYMSDALFFICAALVFVAPTKGTPLNYLEARWACIPGSLGSVKTERQSSWQTTSSMVLYRLKPPVFLRQGPIYLSKAVVWRIGFSGTHLGTYKGALREWRSVEANFVLYLHLALACWYLLERSLFPC